MDVFHDSVVLPGSSAGLQSNATTNNAPSRWNTRNSRLSPSLMKALRDPYNLIGVRPVESGSQKPRAEGPHLDDREWRRQVLQLKITQVCLMYFNGKESRLTGFTGKMLHGLVLGSLGTRHPRRQRRVERGREMR